MKMCDRHFALSFTIIFFLVLLSTSNITARTLSENSSSINYSENSIVTQNNHEIEESRIFEDKEKNVKILNEMQESDTKKLEENDDETQINSEIFLSSENETMRSGRNRRSWWWPFGQQVEIVTFPPCPAGLARNGITLRCEKPGAAFVHGPCPEGQRKDSNENCRQNVE